MAKRHTNTIKSNIDKVNDSTIFNLVKLLDPTGNTTGLLGNKFEEIISKDKNAGALKYQQTIPIVYTTDKRKYNPYIDMLNDMIINK